MAGKLTCVLSLATGTSCNSSRVLKLKANVSSSYYLFKRYIRAERSRAILWEKAQKKPEFHASEDSAVPQKNFDAKFSIEPQINQNYNSDLTIENQFDKLADSVTPLWRIPYEEQLQMKYGRNRTILKQLANRLQFLKSPMKSNHKTLPCELRPVIPSPVLEEYRNKDEFCVKTGADGNPKTVGLYVGSPKNNVAICVNPTKLINTKSSHKVIAEAFQEYIRMSPLPMCDMFDDGGHWRGVTVRSNVKGDLMAVVIMHPQNMTEDELQIEKDKLVEYFRDGAGRICNLKSLYFQACRHTRCSRQQAPYHLLFGDKHIYEELFGMKFRISPDSFFQVNTEAAAILYTAIKDLSDVDQDTVLLDVCCGTGTISLTMAPHVRAAVGIECITEAVEDAKVNSVLNGLRNTEFFVGRAETVLYQLLPSLKSHKLVAVVNPARAGLSFNVMLALRQCEQLNRIIYVSCKPDGMAINNFITLCQSRTPKLTTEPFVPMFAVPIDLFPHTDHCELVIVFEREVRRNKSKHRD